MSYSSKFLESGDAARDLLLEAGYASAAAIEAVTKLSELCIYVSLVATVAAEHEKGTPLPAHFESEVHVNPIKLRGSSTINLVEELENRNVLVPRGNKYRVMLSNMMNRVFSLTANNGPDSIRVVISNLHDVAKFSNALETIEWELVTAIHENVDVKYLDIPSLEANKVPKDLLDNMQSINELARLMSENEIDLNESSDYLIKHMTKGPQGSTNMEILERYLTSIHTLSNQIEIEGKERWKIIQGATKYPVSILNRSGPPLIKSSWHLKPDFRNHPLIEKFKNLMNTNLEFIIGIITMYDGFISDVTENVSRLPRGTSLVDALREKNPALPTSGDMDEWWTCIGKQSLGLKAQLKLLSNLITNVDSLFQNA
ncbi:MAG: hypothetical protein ACFFDR_11245 [Candidatus Thorarchaeota archaeon]